MNNKIASKRARKALKRKNKSYQGDKKIEQMLRKMQAQLAQLNNPSDNSTVFLDA